MPTASRLIFMTQNVPGYSLTYTVPQSGNWGWIVVKGQVALQEHYQSYPQAHAPHAPLTTCKRVWARHRGWNNMVYQTTNNPVTSSRQIWRFDFNG
ncbi:hypothetical protein NBRC116495_10300 [Aurantivibrio plasticivorans]